MCSAVTVVVRMTGMGYPESVFWCDARCDNRKWNVIVTLIEDADGFWTSRMDILDGPEADDDTRQKIEKAAVKACRGKAWQ
jgi:hypothetical protein